MTVDNEWEQRLGALWLDIESHDEASFRKAHEALLSEVPQENSVALFERAAAFDSFGHPDEAAPLYQAALEANVPGERRRRAIIQLASSLRNLGRVEEAAMLLNKELEGKPDHLTGALRAVLALVLADLGREREALSIALIALADYLPRYNKSMTRYAQALLKKT